MVREKCDGAAAAGGGEAGGSDGKVVGGGRATPHLVLGHCSIQRQWNMAGGRNLEANMGYYVMDWW